MWLSALGAPPRAAEAQPPPPRDNRPPSSTARAASSARIAGRIVDESGRPLRKARVTIASTVTAADRVAFFGPGAPPPPPRVIDEPPPPVAFTDNDGRFEVTGLPAGRYTIAVRKAGYVPTTYGARNAGEPPIAIDVEDGTRTDVIVRLPRSAGISGRILDQYGEPIEGALVTAERLSRSEGRIMTRAAGSAATDDLGEFRVGGLPPSRYVVNAYVNRPRDGVFFDIGVTNPAALREIVMPVLGMSQARTYYPGVTGLAQAEPIELRLGEERGSTDFVMPPDAAFPTLTVSFFDADGKSVPGDATLVSANSQIPRFISVPARNPRIATRIEPGAWVVLARGNVGVGMAEVAMGSADVSVSITLAKGGRVSGTFETDGSPLPAGTRFLVSMVHPAQSDAAFGPRWGGTAPIRFDGTFQIGDLLGPMLLRVANNLPRGWTVKAVLYQGRDLSETPIDFKPGTDVTGVRVVLTSRAASVGGTAVDAQGAPIQDYSVLVFPEDRARGGQVRRFARWARPNQQGRFAIDDLLPGEYLAIAVTDVDDTQWQNADYLDRFRAQATRLTLGESERKTITLQLAPQ